MFFQLKATFFSDCLIHPLDTAASPLFLQPGQSLVVYPTIDKAIGLNNGEIIELSCPGGELTFEGESAIDTVTATCAYGSYLRIFSKIFPWDETAHCQNSKAVAKYTQKDCYGGKEGVAGFDLDNGRLIELLRFCFDPHNQTTLYISYELVPWMSSFSNRPIFFEQDEGFFNVGSQDVYKLFDRVNQRKTINTQLGLNSTDTKFIDSKSQFLSRGHIAAAADFYYPVQINATYRYVNVAPQWESINGGNWNQAEISSRKYANAKKITLQVWAGTFGIAKLPHRQTQEQIPLYLFVKDNVKGLPVPEFYWKLLYNHINKTSIVLGVLNNPFLKSCDTVCSDVSSKVPWLKWSQNDIKKGCTFACSYSDFKKKVPYVPSLDVEGLLL